MPVPKLTKKKKAIRDLMDFIEDASRDDSTVGMHFIDELNKGTSATDLYQILVDWGYTGVSLKELTRLVNIFNTKNRAKDALLETGY
jgi:hypothetical protein